MEAWSGVTLPFGIATANLKQLFPTWVAPGTVPSPGTPGFATRVIGNPCRRPMQGTLHSIQVRTDGESGGYIEIWDVNGEDVSVDVSTPVVPLITQAQLDAAIAIGRAKLIYRQDFTAGFGAATPSAPPRAFLHGLAGRFVGSGGFVELNLVVEHGFRVDQ